MTRTPYHKVVEAYRLAKEHPDWTYLQIGKAVKCERRTASLWLNSPDKYRPDIDGVAVDRALAGTIDPDTLTMWEKEAFVDAVAEMIPQWDAAVAHEDAQGHEGAVRFGERWPLLRKACRDRQRERVSS